MSVEVEKSPPLVGEIHPVLEVIHGTFSMGKTEYKIRME